jgi:hypothetical protein
MVVFCTEDSCTTRASFGFLGKEILKCKAHKIEGMICLTLRRCIETNCTTAANFNYIHSRSPLYCGTHKLDGMLCITKRTCLIESCYLSANFNFPSESKGLYCNAHKLPRMININLKRCIEPTCSISASYGTVGTTKPLYCVAHKKVGMSVVIKYNRCQIEDCGKRPTYGEEIGSKTHCVTHRTTTMISQSGVLCTNCHKRASYNYLGETNAIYCNSHKLEGMINIRDSKCIESGCYRIPSFNTCGEKKAIYCRLHKKAEMVNVREKVCKTTYCTTQVGNNKYDGYCLRCYMFNYPDKPVSRNYKTKEKAVRDFIATSYPTQRWTFDARLSSGKSLRRPDAVLDLSSYALIIEVDENQHISYDCSCENKRIMELSMDLEHKPITFIRFNPDSYIDSSGSCYKSCWKTDGNGILRVHKEDSHNWDARLNTLKETIDYWLLHPSDKTINIIELYFDMNPIT